MIKYVHLVALKEYNLMTSKVKASLTKVQPQNSVIAFYVAQLMGKATSEQEAVIAQNGYRSYLYAKNILCGPFPLGEPAIRRDQIYWKLYQKLLATWKAEQTLKSQS